MLPTNGESPLRKLALVGAVSHGRDAYYHRPESLAVTNMTGDIWQQSRRGNRIKRHNSKNFAYLITRIEQM